MRKLIIAVAVLVLASCGITDRDADLSEADRPYIETIRQYRGEITSDCEKAPAEGGGNDRFNCEGRRYVAVAELAKELKALRAADDARLTGLGGRMWVKLGDGSAASGAVTRCSEDAMFLLNLDEQCERELDRLTRMTDAVVDLVEGWDQ